MSFVKTVIVVDAQINVQNIDEVLNVLLNKTDLKRDLHFSEGILDALNHASDNPLYGSKLGIDATMKIQGEPGFGDKQHPSVTAPLPDSIIKNFPEVKACRLLEKQSSLPVLFVALSKTRKRHGKEFIQSFFSRPEYSAIAILIVLESHDDVKNNTVVMWKLLNNLDPRRDCHFIGDHLGIDVTRKSTEEGYNQKWPDEINMSPEVKSRIDQQWKKLFV